MTSEKGKYCHSYNSEAINSQISRLKHGSSPFVQTLKTTSSWIHVSTYSCLFTCFFKSTKIYYTELVGVNSFIYLNPVYRWIFFLQHVLIKHLILAYMNRITLKLFQYAFLQILNLLGVKSIFFFFPFINLDNVLLQSLQ